MKTYFGNLASSWTLKNPGQLITIHHMPELITDGYLSASTPQNIISRFQSAGIWPIDRHMLLADWFLPADMSEQQTENSNHPPEPESDQYAQDNGPSTLSCVAFTKPPAKCRPFPGSSRATSTANRGRKRTKAVTGYITQTPELHRWRPKEMAMKTSAKVKRKMIQESPSSSDLDDDVDTVLPTDSKDASSLCDNEGHGGHLACHGNVSTKENVKSLGIQ